MGSELVRRIAVARGDEPADLVLSGGRVLSVFTGEFLEAFWPGALDTTNGNGVWAMEVDPKGCLWFGGDMKQGSWTGTAYQWLGGFGKFCQRDATAPTTPTNLTATRTAGTTPARGT